jgi:2-dehydropantoate 2-reductase
MKICISGAGALGCAIGGVLARGGSDVVLLNRPNATLETIKARGLTMRNGADDQVVKVKACSSCAGLSPVDLVIVLVKSFATRFAIEASLPIVGPDTLVMSLQNGLGHEDVLAEFVGRERLLAGKTYVGGIFIAPGHVLYGIEGKRTYIGELDGQMTPRLQSVVDEFNKAGLPTTASANIQGTMWDKLLVNLATGALSAITRLPYGRLYAIAEIEATALAAIAEGIAVARAHGIGLSSEDPLYFWPLAAQGLPPEFKASMLQSVEKGQMTEIDFINGSVVRWGERAGIATPVNKTLVACVKGIESGLAIRGGS